MNDQHTLRPIDLANDVGISVQQVRNYEAWGFLPQAERKANGYRAYTSQHLQAIRAVRTMIAGYGWQQALLIMRAAHSDDLDAAFAAVDARHAELDSRRCEIEQTLGALKAISASPPGAPARNGRGGRASQRIGAVAESLGVRVSALRFWEEQELVVLQREPSSGYRYYDEEQIRRLRIIVLLRQGGYNADAIRPVLSELAAGRPERAIAAAEQRLNDLAAASRRCAQATAAFWGYCEAFLERTENREPSTEHREPRTKEQNTHNS
jgi:DNA-binding transcriptional MerR regulator